MEDRMMLSIVQFPTVVQESLKTIDLPFPDDPDRAHFAGYLPDLIVSAKKNVSAIDPEFALRPIGSP
jgi:hypothetical protein